MQSNHWRWIVLALFALALFGLWQSGWLAELSLANLKAHRLELSAWVDAHWWLAVAGFFLLYVVATGISLPGAAVLTLAAGALFGLLAGTLIVSFASSIGATLAFLASRFILRDGLIGRYKERLRAFNQGIDRDCAFYLMSMRLVPVFPFFLINLMAGLTLMTVKKFYLVSQIAMLPATVVFVFAGTQLARIESPGDVLSPGMLLAFTLLGVLPLLLRLLLKRLHAGRIPEATAATSAPGDPG